MHTWKNQFRGVNPLLMKQLFAPGDESVWPSFHAAQIGHLRSYLNKTLPPKYVAHAEQSLQIRLGDLPEQHVRPLRPIPDVSIYRGASEARIAEQESVEVVSTPTWSAVVDYSVVEKMIPSIVIRNVEAKSHSLLGAPVTRIEILSPDNMPGSAGFSLYLRNRGLALRSGTSLVEVDYLHEYPSPVEKIMELPAYPQENGSYPYNIVINRVEASREVQVNIYGFSMDEPIPSVEIPLAGEESIVINLDKVHMQIYEEERWGLYVDYSLPLENRWLKTFSQRDQQHIINRRLAVIDAARRNLSLDTLLPLNEVMLSTLQAEGLVHPEIIPVSDFPLLDHQQVAYWFGILPRNADEADSCLIIRDIDHRLSDHPIQAMRITSGSVEKIRLLNSELETIFKSQGVEAVFERIREI